MAINYMACLPDESRIALRYFPQKKQLIIGGDCMQMNTCIMILKEYFGLENEVEFKVNGNKIRSLPVSVSISVFSEGIDALKKNNIVVEGIKKIGRLLS